MDAIATQIDVEMQLFGAIFDQLYGARFRRNARNVPSNFGLTPYLIAALWLKLKSLFDETRISCRVHLLWALYWLRAYPSESQACAHFAGMRRGAPCAQTFRERTRVIVECISRLGLVSSRISKESSAAQIPRARFAQVDFESRHEDWRFSIPSFSVDGTDCHINHVSRKRRLGGNDSFFSFKHKHDGLRFWVAMHMYKPIIVAYGGGYPAGRNHDIEVARRDVVPMMRPGEMALADGGYLDSYRHFFTPLDGRFRDAALRQLGSQANVDVFTQRTKSVERVTNTSTPS